ncbi:MAG: phosphate ABC transporter, permease protein PstA [Novosphingobium sp. 28-62-57]|uniref:phosphate ABC transporter permease PstA n=1 Tax=unclassified Novosphingobium TaxID=2644732 RepID=UPI000BCF68B4|nr:MULTISPECIES: phosphate ABC transporter permease PstA [unclassified Novosphingobium]OYW48947.1 MAG: phosphate ABC transporter, permease protein PstA [Novosphingobium sp. 12-62-10]OYZ09588.1 MAG: phosphate ABC transporter, permease protein PstA [Novosphingobium sp. 28-62-57]OZA34323.1 MAG: phosphate ABC transporter, permease protein PstA [Novosphingobium sp. 17-62-9]HQS68621.1 phosphate ABC transporter permease PstA [Novosphingobium sp.]
MTEALPMPSAAPSFEEVQARRRTMMESGLAKRKSADRRFRVMGFIAVTFSALMLVLLLINMGSAGFAGFQRSEVRFDIPLAGSMQIDAERLTQPDPMAGLELAGLERVVQSAAAKALGSDADDILANGAWREVADMLIEDPSLLSGSVTVSLPASDALARAMRGDGDPAGQAMVNKLKAEGKLVRQFDEGFLSRSDATSPQSVGIWGALKGSMLTMFVTLVLAFPIGVLSALYLEEYAPKNRWTDIIEISINNLAAVPSIIFGLLGLAVFLALFPNLRSAPLIGGMTLALMTMPVIVISGRNAIKAVPPSIRDAALAIGASKVQVVFNHVLPLALPGILTGTIIGMARALGETAPLLMIGMRAFVASPPSGFTSPSSVLPVQIFLWSDEIDRGFIERTSAAIVVLLIFLLLMNGLAIYLRNRFEQRW